MVEPSLSFGKISSTVPVRDEYAPWLALGRVKGLGGVGFKKLAASFADPTEAFFASIAELEQVEGLHREVIEGIGEFFRLGRDRRRTAPRPRRRRRDRALYVARYPARLRMIADPPPFLIHQGCAWWARTIRAVAIVGSRSASDYGRRVARDLARGLASLGFTVVSGMARGIDGARTKARYSAGGRTIAVLGSGVERPYPPEHEALYRRISENGAVVSELPVGTRPIGV